MNKLVGFALVLAVVALGVWQLRAHPAPAVFSSMSYQEAFAQQSAPNKVLLVKATASWCGPCKAMDKDTFGDPRVEAWFKDDPSRLAVQLDIDRYPDQARGLRIEGVPTSILLVGGQEAARTVGYVGPDGFLLWLGTSLARAGDAR